jgi:hypothetical protein
MIRRFFRDYKQLKGKTVEVDEIQRVDAHTRSSRKRFTVIARNAAADSRTPDPIT